MCLKYENYDEMNFVVASNYFKDSHIINQKSTQMFQLGTNGTLIKMSAGGFPGGAVVENLPANAGNTGSSPGLGRSHMPRSN